MNLAIQLNEFWLGQIGKAREMELLAAERAERVVIRRKRKSFARALKKARVEKPTPKDCGSEVEQLEVEQLTPSQAKVLMKERGHSYRSAAKFLGVHFTHLDRVLQGHRESKTLMAKISNLPIRRKGGRP